MGLYLKVRRGVLGASFALDAKQLAIQYEGLRLICSRRGLKLQTAKYPILSIPQLLSGEATAKLAAAVSLTFTLGTPVLTAILYYDAIPQETDGSPATSPKREDGSGLEIFSSVVDGSQKLHE